MTGEHQAVYTHGHHESVLRAHRRRTAEDSAGYLLPHLRPGLSVLDVGCGPGTITVDLAARVAPGQVTAVELTSEALDLARAEARARDQTNIAFATSDIHALVFPDDTFDIVHAHQVLQHVADPVQALGELRRVCKPGGIVCGPRRGLRGIHLVSTASGAGPLAGPLRHRRACERRRARRGAAAVGLGAGRRVRRHHTIGQHVVFRHAGDPRLVGWDVGGPDHRVGPRPTVDRLRAGHNRGAQRDLIGMAGLGRGAGWLAGDPARRDFVSGVA